MICEPDPHESNNLAGKEKYTDKLSEPKKKIRQFQKRTDDRWRVKWRHE